MFFNKIGDQYDGLRLAKTQLNALLDKGKTHELMEFINHDEWIKHVSADVPKFNHVLGLLALRLVAEGKTDEAELIASKIEGELDYSIYSEGDRLHFAKKMGDKEIEALQLWMKSRKSSQLVPLVNLITAYQMKTSGKVSEALKFIDENIGDCPQLNIALGQIAYSLSSEEGKMKDAIALVERMDANYFYEEFSTILFNMLRSKDPHLVLSLVEAKLKDSEKKFELFRSIGTLLIEKGEIKEASRLLSEMVRLGTEAATTFKKDRFILEFASEMLSCGYADEALDLIQARENQEIDYSSHYYNDLLPALAIRLASSGRYEEASGVAAKMKLEIKMDSWKIKSQKASFSQLNAQQMDNVRKWLSSDEIKNTPVQAFWRSLNL
jgi:hypothetical protein